MTAELEFKCKDPLITRHYERMCKEDFTKRLNENPDLGQLADWELYKDFYYEMFNEAVRQEHWDYTVDSEGVRHPKAKHRGSGFIALYPSLKVIYG